MVFNVKQKLNEVKRKLKVFFVYRLSRVYKPENLECEKRHRESGSTDSLYDVVGIENLQIRLRTRPPELGWSMHRFLKTTSKSPREPVALENSPTASPNDTSQVKISAILSCCCNED